MSQNIIENDYYSKIEELVNNTGVFDFNSFVELDTKISSVYFDICNQLLNLTKGNNSFTFKDYIEKRAFLKKHNDSILNEIYYNNIQLFS